MYMGIDESNSGKEPEVYVCCFSNSRNHLRRNIFTKKRNKSNRKLSIPYRHILFFREHNELIGHENLPVIAVCEFAQYINRIDPIKRIYIDGILSENQMGSIERIIHAFNEDVRIINQKQLDEKILIVNEADNIANMLFRYYSRKGASKNKYVDKMISPKFEKYLQYIK